MHFALFLACITFLGWGTGDLFTIVAVRKIGANLTTFWIFFFSFILLLLILPFAPHNFSAITVPLLLLNIFLGIIFISGNVLISEAFRTTSAPLVGIIIQSFPAVVLLLDVLMYRDKVTPIQLLFICIIFLGVILCSVKFKTLRKTERIFDRGTILALTATLCLSIFFTLSRILIETYGWLLPNLFAIACFPIILLFLKKTKEKFYMPNQKQILFATFMVAFLIRAGDTSLNYALTLPNASSIVAPIAGAAPILFVTSSYLIYKDKLSKQQLIGICITLIGIFSLTAFGQ